MSCGYLLILAGLSVVPGERPTEQRPAQRTSKSSARLIVRELPSKKGVADRTQLEISVRNDGRRPIRVRRRLPLNCLRMQIKSPGGRYFESGDPYPTRRQAPVADRDYAEIAAGKTLKLCTVEFGLRRPLPGGWIAKGGEPLRHEPLRRSGSYQFTLRYHDSDAARFRGISRISGVKMNVRLRTKEAVFFRIPKGADLRLLAVMTKTPKRAAGKIVLDVFVHNRGKQTITIWDGIPLVHLAVQVKRPDGRVYRLKDAYPTSDIGYFSSGFVRVPPGRPIFLARIPLSVPKGTVGIGGVWLDDRGGGTQQVAFKAKGSYQFWFAYAGNGSPFAYKKAAAGTFAEIKNGAIIPAVTIEVKRK